MRSTNSKSIVFLILTSESCAKVPVVESRDVALRHSEPPLEPTITDAADAQNLPDLYENDTSDKFAVNDIYFTFANSKDDILADALQVHK